MLNIKSISYIHLLPDWATPLGSAAICTPFRSVWLLLFVFLGMEPGAHWARSALYYRTFLPGPSAVFCNECPFALQLSYFSVHHTSGYFLPPTQALMRLRWLGFFSHLSLGLGKTACRYFIIVCPWVVCFTPCLTFLFTGRMGDLQLWQSFQNQNRKVQRQGEVIFFT